MGEMASYEHEFTADQNASNDPLKLSSTAKKRNRISFVCQACRRSKTKCDREKPTCGRCAQHGIPCIYDVEKQSAPKNPSKDAKIARLERDLEYWKNKALNELPDHKTIGPSKRPFKTENNNGSQKAARVSSTNEDLLSYENGHIEDIQINIYKNHPSMIMNRIMKREVKPLAENYAITQDKFLSGLIASVFLEGSKNTMIPALTANASVYRAQPSVRDNVLKIKEMLIRQCHSEPQKNRINEFTERILQNTTTDNNLRLGMLPAPVMSTSDRLSIEDFCPNNGEYSDLLKSFIKRMELILPPVEIINKYKENFYENIFPKLPFLNIQSFEDSLSNTLFPDENDPSKVRILLSNSRIRSKMENLSTLLVMLKLSYISLRFIDESSPDYKYRVEEKILEEYPIGGDFILLAENCLLAQNLYSCANENIITCLLYIWSFFVYSPEEGDFFLEHPTDVLGGLIVMLGTSIGLHRDPSEFSPLCRLSKTEVGLLNHRRLLWVAITTVICFESCLKGRYPLSLEVAMNQFIDFRKENALDIYLERVKQDMISFNSDVLRLHESGFQQALLALLISDLDRMTLNYKKTFSLYSFEALRGRIEQYVEYGTFSTDVKSTDVNIQSSKNINHGKKIAEDKVRGNFIGQHPLTMSRLILLRSSMALFFHFEFCLLQERHFMQYYKRYFLKVCADSVSLANCITQMFSECYKATSLPSNNYYITKAAQMALSSNFFGLLGMILRIELAGNVLFAKYHDSSTRAGDDQLQEYAQKMEYLSALKKDLEMAIEGIYNVASVHLRFTYYSVFKMLALFDVIIQKMRKGELWSAILILENVKAMNANTVKGLGMTLSLDLNDQTSIVDQLRSRNFLVDLSVKDIVELYEGVRCANLRTQTLKSNYVESETMKYETPSAPLRNSPLDNLDKLTSVATMSQNSDFESNLGDQRSSNSGKVPGENRSQLAEDNRANGEGAIFRFGPSTENEPEIGAGSEMPMEFSGLFGGLDLFDYDFLFSNDL
ncbi:hypothetical protein HG535_0E02230 [Zygotorulaspora mrakii]|uniref:Zn(2)-C6 fungal-type domain-containing protein n=1 Tax=Zygotorulaspora mrakii TaxID=42260 RepID=A0A7H9B592_ZYGMR|nr:uncharacterized protein HG535_0E02230 [Zygotorulaspora mrakii]QLG73139.1 hypothetical protein HG535_0E02230 [Zygotorulaspora mrakii]